MQAVSVTQSHCLCTSITTLGPMNRYEYDPSILNSNLEEKVATPYLPKLRVFGVYFKTNLVAFWSLAIMLRYGHKQCLTTALLNLKSKPFVLLENFHKNSNRKWFLQKVCNIPGIRCRFAFTFSSVLASSMLRYTLKMLQNIKYIT